MFLCNSREEAITAIQEYVITGDTEFSGGACNFNRTERTIQLQVQEGFAVLKGKVEKSDRSFKDLIEQIFAEKAVELKK